MKTSLWERNETWERVIQLKETERNRLVKLCAEELQIIANALQYSTQNMETVFSSKVQNSQELQEIKSSQQMLKSKVRILESELDKALTKCKQYEEGQTLEKTKMDRLTDLIKDIWMAEVQVKKQGGTFKTMGSHGVISGHQLATIGQSEYHTFMMPDVPMPISWLSDIADHIKQLKEMNDVQRDDVYQLYLLLSQHECRTGNEKDSISDTSHSEASPKAQLIVQPSSEEEYIISENEAEST